MFGRYGGARPKKNKTGQKQAAFTPEDATLEGFDIPLKTTRLKKPIRCTGRFKAQARRLPRLAKQGYDQLGSPWTGHRGFFKMGYQCRACRWQDLHLLRLPQRSGPPHGYVDSDLTDGLPGENKGKVLSDPSHGSDSGFIRDLEGNFHVIFENWNPINASKRAWDSPLAGHAVSPDGVSPLQDSEGRSR